MTPAGAGYLFDHVAMSLPFEIGALLQCSNAVVYWIFFRHMRPPEEAVQPVAAAPPPAEEREPASAAGA
jgi:hypothetical protein